MQAIEDGEFDLVNADYRQITGRPARSMRKFLKAVGDTASA
jgi:hypothetical protein